MFQQFKSFISRNIKNAPGWRSSRKFIVIESDDWGGIRMPNSRVYNELLSSGIRVDLCPYNKYDTLANAQDLEALYSLLKTHADFKNNHPIITFNTNVVNPDFDRIKEGSFEKYYYEDFTTTLNRYYPNEDVFSLWKEGIKEKFIFPQFHGREHLNPEIWLDLLNNVESNTHLLKAFQHKTYGLSLITSNEIKLPFLASFIYKSKVQERNVATSVIEGTAIFERIFGFKSKSIIAPLYTWPAELENTFENAGIKYIQGSDKHKEYDFIERKYKRIYHVMGKENKFRQIYLHRNCYFEPTIHTGKDNIGDCLKQIESAFFWNKPAVISMHRLNFIGALDEDNRSRNLEALDILLTKIKKKWKNVEFMHSSELGDIIQNCKSNVI
ncbi:polysaccharide (de)acetylase [Gelidibacter japonicus]|uniref:polysaccharide (de)acetylase n=1 Tax=Gelidibacter japonicus TaxID=1962232 RepID=UPI002021BD9D|nr:polysaccharide (de)acetylase [Gelidibacter japonicus]MCL8006652.1 polysaccharide (de)acetylase [Gelidibacter japonicus]